MTVIRWILALTGVAVAWLATPVLVDAQEDLFDMSLEELADARIDLPGILTSLTAAEVPAAITEITFEDLRQTPARNLYDLLEVYVPGASWMTWEEGAGPGVRGIIADRNVKFLLLVNGRVMNSKAHFGAKSELEQWDLGDIQRIHIVRGPGSVTYGPGAVAGVINIVTRNARSTAGTSVEARYVGAYASRGVSVSHTFRGERLGIYAFGSVTRTSGHDAPQFWARRNDQIGYVGQDILTDTEPMEYFADYDDRPQVKVHLDGTFADAWRGWIRYTQQGSTWRSNEAKTDVNGSLINLQGVRDRQWSAVLAYDTEVAGRHEASLTLGLDSFEGGRRKDDHNHDDLDHPLNMVIWFAETELFARGRINWQASRRAEVAFGAEYAHDRYGGPWGGGALDMRLGDGGVIISGPSSNALEPGNKGTADRDGTREVFFVGDGWATHTTSAFAEANIVLSEGLKALASARADHSTESPWLFSPRLAFIANVGNDAYLKLAAQQSHRLNTAGQVYAASVHGTDPDTESARSIELAFTGVPRDGVRVDVSGFLTGLSAIAWDNAVNSSVRVGELSLVGVEVEFDGRFTRGRLGASYSHVKQLDWTLEPGVTSSGISYADNNQPLQNTSAVLTGYGNDLNNWPNQSVKAVGRFDVTPRLRVHADARVFWDFQGAKDGLEALRRAVAGQPEQPDVEGALAAVSAYDVYAADARLGASVSYSVSDRFDVTAFAQNLLYTNDAKRYSYDYGNDTAIPRRVRFVGEPRSFGVKLHVTF